VSTPTIAPPEFRHVRIELIDEPELAMRESMNDERMGDLIASIRRLGLLQPIGLVQVGARFRVSFGHRRFIACRQVPMQAIPSMVFAEGTPDEEAMKVAENEDREEVNAGEAALYLNELLERKCGGDVDRLCDYVKKKRGYVEDRLLLLAGDLEVLQELRARRIRFSVAKELNKVKDTAARRQFLDAAIRGGANGALVRRWREEHELFQSRQAQPASAESEDAKNLAPQPIESVMRCRICNGADDFHEMEVVYQHRSCAKVEQRAFENQPAIGARS